MGALAAVDQLRREGFIPRRPVGVVNFADEEGARFGVACAGSRVITGALGADRARGLNDPDGVTMAEAMRRAGHDPATSAVTTRPSRGSAPSSSCTSSRAGPWSSSGTPVGVGSDIWPHGRWRVDIAGRGQPRRYHPTRGARGRHARAGRHGHRRPACRRGEDCVATVGKVHVVPGRVNAIASSATGWLDARGTDPDQVLRVVAEVRDVVADFDGLVTQESWTPTTEFDPDLARRIAGRLGDVPVIGTGAGHDAGILANDGIRTAMLFVRNPTGVSHSPDEWASADDCLAGINALADVVTDLAGAGG